MGVVFEDSLGFRYGHWGLCRDMTTSEISACELRELVCNKKSTSGSSGDHSSSRHGGVGDVDGSAAGAGADWCW